ncbi:MAG: bifunctional UDP-N-acetylmuramoyl-tripeptide:D-alanyl-D-alanine ligase/alanine racemase [Bacteroidales bacterium]|nr:bifunctional UDP-N-acetylmuramoyl-tripeptide:D-alanyl-D-alanine ligase/alanine racemase [Bacteroidales bacterium]
MIVYTTKDIASLLKGKSRIEFNDEITYLLLDSRTVSSPADSLFFALVGDRHNGHDYIEDLHKKGVRNFVISQSIDNFSHLKSCNFIQVENTLKALQLLVASHRAKFKIPVIGITGSNGKTVLKEWIFQLLQDDKNIVRSPKSYNSQIGVPLSVWLLKENTEIAIFEAGISNLGEMSNLEKIIKPTIGIFTNIGDAHQENFIDYKHKISEKIKLFENSEFLIYCRDYQLIETQIQSNKNFEETKLVTWSAKYPADLFITGKTKQEGSTLIKAKYIGKEVEINIPFIDEASIENAIHCWILMLFLGYDNSDINRRMSLLSPVAMRLELKEGNNNCTVINDSYNSDIGSLNIALDFLIQQQQQPHRVLILSDILQSGKEEKSLYLEVANLVNKKQIDHFIGVGTAISRFSEFFKNKTYFFSGTDELIENLPKLKIRDSVILLKGARRFQFEKVSTLLQQKAHETVLEINLSAVTHNLNFFKSKLNPGVKLNVMVKAFSYGSGIFEIANLLEFHRVDYLSVAFADEGVELRKGGINLPILVLNPEEPSFDLMIENRLEPEIFSFRIFDLFKEAVNRNHINHFPVHIKLDTGMHRLGFCEKDIDELISRLKHTPQLKICSVFSHLAASDEKNHDDFTKSQIELFVKMSSKMEKELKTSFVKHILNSAGIERFPQAQFEMVRLGIGLYGISNSYADKLRNVSTLKTSISQIKTIENTETIGYSRKGKISQTTSIATLPIGYADGLNRRLSNGLGKVLINGSFAPIIGNICMDMCMVDITGIEAEEGDEAIIFGDQYPLNKLAEQLETIPYEVMTGISRRVKRVYYQE